MDKEAFWAFLILALLLGIFIGFSFQNTITASVISSDADVYSDTALTSETAPKCYDSDGGSNIYSQGVCVDSAGNKYQDYCLYPDCTGLAECGYDIVVEYACVEGKCYPYQFKCPYGCNNGVCMKEAAQALTTKEGETFVIRQTDTQTQIQETTQATTRTYGDTEASSDVVLKVINITSAHSMYSPSCVARMGSPFNQVTYFYRNVVDCSSGTVLERQMIINNGNYCNFRCKNRYEEQCVMDGTFDTYYVERCPEIIILPTEQTQEATQTEYQLQTKTQETTQTQTQTRTVWDVVAGFLGIDTSKEEREPSTEVAMPKPGMYETGFYEQSGIVSTPKPEIVSVNAGITYEGVLTMLRDAIIIEVINSSEINCNLHCSRYGRTCIHAETQYFDNGQWIFHPATCNAYSNTSMNTLHCWCTRPPTITTTAQQQTYAYADY